MESNSDYAGPLKTPGDPLNRTPPASNGSSGESGFYRGEPSPPPPPHLKHEPLAPIDNLLRGVDKRRSARLQFLVMSEETPIPQPPAISEELRAYLREIGRRGGSNRSARKVRAARRNVRKAARVMIALSMKSLKRWQQRSAV